MLLLRRVALPLNRPFLAGCRKTRSFAVAQLTLRLTMVTTKLKWLNLYRWLKEYIILWTLLGSIYSLAGAVLFQPIFQWITKKEPSLLNSWLLTNSFVIISWLFHSFLSNFSFKQANRYLVKAHAPLSTFFCVNELRKVSVLAVIFVTVITGAFLNSHSFQIWVILAQLPIQVSLFNLKPWEQITLQRSALVGAKELLRGLLKVQLITAILATILVVTLWIVQGQSVSLAIIGSLASGVLGASLMSAGVALEGDSGRPFLVNSISLVSGTLAGLLCFAMPVSLLFCLYLYHRFEAVTLNRLRSIAPIDEDTLV